MEEIMKQFDYTKEIKKRKVYTYAWWIAVGLLSIVFAGLIFYYRRVFLSKAVWGKILENYVEWVIPFLAILFPAIIAFFSSNGRGRRPAVILCFIGLIPYVAWTGIHYQSELEETTADSFVISEPYIFAEIPIIVDTSFHSTHEREPEEQKTQVIFDMLEESFVQYLQKITGGEIWQNRYYQDYEGNGECQMFAVVEKNADDNRSSAENGYGTLWYVDKYGAVEVDNEVKEYLPGAISFLENGYIFQTFQQYRTEGNTAFVWSVLDGKPYQPAISGLGSDIRVNEFGDIEVVVPGKRSGAETAEEMVYYFYLDDTNTLREYGGREISAGEFERIPGMQDVLAEMYARKCWTQTIYYRENGIININCYKEYGAEVKRYLVTIRHEGSAWQYIHSEDGKEYRAGTCLEALIPSIATYPDKLPY